MPVIVAMIGGMLLNITRSIVGRVLLALGLSVVTFTGVNTGIATLRSTVQTGLSGLPAEVLQMLAIMKVGTGLTMIFAAITASMVLRGLTGDTFRRIVGG